MNFTALRLILAAALLLVVGMAMLPRMTSYVSISALVNAPLVSVSAPFDGEIERPSKPVAQAIFKGDLLFSLKNSRYQRSELQSFEAELNSVSGEIVGLKKQLDDLGRLQIDLIKRRDAKIAARRLWFEPRLDEAKWSIARAEAQHIQAADVYERILQLSTKGNVREFDLIEALADRDKAAADLELERAHLRRMEVEEASLDGSPGVNMASDDFDQIEYRIDEIAIRSADLDARLLALQSRRASLKTQISRSSIESMRRETFSPIATTSGIVWNASLLTGSPVSDGERIIEVLDCSRRFLEVILPERHFEKVPVGTKAFVKLKGSTETFSAEVIAAYGSGARPNRAMQAASPRIDIVNGIRVIVARFGEVDLLSEQAVRTFCDVGRAAEVRFETKETVITGAVSAVANWFGAIIPNKTADELDVPAPLEG